VQLPLDDEVHDNAPVIPPPYLPGCPNHANDEGLVALDPRPGGLQLRESDILQDPHAAIDVLRAALARETDERRRADCMAKLQADAVQLALDLLVREPDVAGFFRGFIKILVEECESYAAGVWLVDDDSRGCQLWMAHMHGHVLMKHSDGWDALELPRESMAQHLFSYAPGWTEIIDYSGDDMRLPEPVKQFNTTNELESLIVAPLVLGTRTLGWIGLTNGPSDECEGLWRRALLDAVARQATLALHQNRLAEQRQLEERRKAVLEERNRLARDIHDSLAQGFAAILMQLQAAQRAAVVLPPGVANALDTAVELARTHMVEARRSVCALRPQTTLGEGEDLTAALRRIVLMARRTSEVPIELVAEELPPFGGDVEREVLGIVQEGLNNAIRHARARQITVQVSVVRSLGLRVSIADDGRGIAKERRGAGFGMTSMQERAERIGASLTIVTAPRSGTEIVLAWEPPAFFLPSRDHVA
jgi:signal transduction histidine kinase